MDHVGSSAGPPASRQRPGPLRWLWYAVGGRLPDAYREWVLLDLTRPTWPLRHLVRLFTQLVPVTVPLLVLLPGPLWVRGTAIAVGSTIGLLYSFVFLYEATEARATKAGFPHGTLQRAREERRASAALARAVASHERAVRSRYRA
jgi:hypothetical protein